MKKPDKQGADNASPEVDKESFSTSISGLPVPFFQGEGAPAIRWVSRIYGQRVVETSSGGGKGGKGGGGKKAEYFGTLVGTFACDGVDTIEKILSSGRAVFPNDINRWTSSNPVRVTLEGVGQADIYWGLESDPVDTLLNSYEPQGPMPGVAKIVLRDISFGKNGETVAPNLKIISRRSPRQTLVTGDPSATDGHFTCNPIASAAEFLTSWNWANQPNSKFVASTFQAVADSFQAEVSGGRLATAIAPQITERKTLRSVFADIESSTGAWIRRATDGRIECGRWVRNPSALTVTTFGFEDFTDFPKGSTEDIDSLDNEFKLDFRNAYAFHKRDSVTVRNQAMINRLGGRIKTKTVTRDDVITKDLAHQAARELARVYSQPILGREFKVRAGKCYNPNGSRIRPGDYFKAPISKPGRPLVLATFRCLRRRISINSGEIVLQGEREISASMHPAPTPDPENLFITNAVAPITAARVVSLPPINDDDTSICALAGRPTLMATECEISYQNSGSDDYQALGRAPFALPLNLNAACASGAGTIQVKLGVSQAYRRDAHTLTAWTGGAQEGRDDQLLLIVVRKASGWGIASVAGTSRDWVEVMSVSAPPALVAPDVYNVSVLRGRLGTVPLDFNAGSFPDTWTSYEVWCVPESNLRRFYHADFTPLVGSLTLVNFRLTGVSASAEYNPADAFEERTRLAAASLPLNDFASQPDDTTFVPTVAFDFPYTFTSAPAAPSGLTAITGWGKGVALKWSPLSTAQVNEYRIFRATGPGFSDETQIATDSDGAYTDYNVVTGTEYRYRIRAEATDNDATNSGLSPFSSAVFATPSGIGDFVAPPAPSPMNLVGSGFRPVADGSVKAFLNFNFPGLTGNGFSQSVVYSIGSVPLSQGEIAHQKENTSAIFVQIDDLTPGTVVNVGSQQYSSGGTPSAITVATGSPFTTPSKTSRPAAPASVVTTMPTSGDGFPPSTNSLSNIANGTWVETPTTSDPTVVMCEMWWAFDAPVDNAAYPDAKRWPITLSRFAYTMYFPSPSGFIWVRFVDKFGNYSAWTRTPGVANFGSGHAGNIISENKSDTKLSGVTVSQGAGGRRQKVVYPVNDVYSNASAGVEVAVNVPVSGFLYKPDASSAPNLASAGGYSARYDWDNAGNSATNAVVMITKHDGSSIPVGVGFRITGDFVGY